MADPAGTKRSFVKSRPARWLLVLGTVVLALRYIVAPLVFWRAAERCERPDHEVVGILAGQSREQQLRVELRHYAPYLVAEVQVPLGNSEEERRAEGFQQVAGYIFGSNLRRRTGLVGRWAPLWAATEPEPEKIAMTAPVQTEDALGQGKVGTATVSFTMPSKYGSLRELPVPKNRNVTLRAVPEHYVAAVGFRGPPPTSEKVSEVRLAILTAVEQIGLRVSPGRGVMLYQYHDPFATPNLLRWNEVVVPLESGDMSGFKRAQV